MTCRVQEASVKWTDGKEVWHGWVAGIPEEKKKSRLVPMEIGDRNVLLYVPKDSLSAQVACGDELWFYARIRPPRNREGSTFDYAAYLKRQGVSGTAYAGKDQWKRGDRHRTPGWKQWALQRRDELVDAYRSCGFTGDVLAVVSALTLGDKRSLDPELRDRYSRAGASHILALSGLHLNIIMMVVSHLLLVHNKRYHWARGLILIALLWAFAFLTGLSGSVVRSAVMFTVFILGRCLRRRSPTLNSLAFAACVMLLYEPYYLLDVGFQLSFAAVAGIALFMPVFFPRMEEHRRLGLHSVGQLVGVSLAAQLGVAPLVAYHFGNFSVYFLLTNLLVIPLTMIILCLSLLWWVLYGFSIPLQWVDSLLQGMLWALNAAVSWVSRLSGASVDVSFNGYDLAYYYVLLLGLLACYHFRSWRTVYRLLGCLCACLAAELIFARW